MRRVHARTGAIPPVLGQGTWHVGQRRSERAREVAAAQVARAWCIRSPGVVAIPKASKPQHARDDAAAADLVLTKQDLDDLDTDCAVPHHDVPFEMI